MNILFFTFEQLKQFRENIRENIEKYRLGKLDFINENEFRKYEREKINDFDFDISKEKPSDSDLNNIKLVYTSFKFLRDDQATDERVWAGLCHTKFAQKYLKYRWDCQTEDEIKRRYFFKDGNRSIIMNGIARLWWYGRLTYNENSENPFELTEYICQNLTLKGTLPLTLNFSNKNQLSYHIYF